MGCTSDKNENVNYPNNYYNINLYMNESNTNKDQIINLKNRIEHQNYRKPNKCCCPVCFEPLGNNFYGSGKNTDYFDCLKCGDHQSGKTYFFCDICNSIFCTKCPFKNYNTKYSCPVCGENIGNRFQSSGKKTDYFDCLKCGDHQSGKNYFFCRICNSIFCYKCPYKNYKTKYSCPICGQIIGNKFYGSGTKTEYFACFKCGDH